MRRPTEDGTADGGTPASGSVPPLSGAGGLPSGAPGAPLASPTKDVTLGLWAEEAGVSDAPPADGPTMVGRYLLGPCCGRGGMGAVFRSTDRDLGREVAIKVMAEELRDDSQSHERFHRERRACARMDHGNVVRVHDAGVEDGLPFLVMEWLEGKTLHEILSRRGALPIPDAVAATVQALEGLRHAHRRGVIHRDVKPQNLLLTRDGVVKVLDWGISRFLDGVAADEAEFVTRGLVVLGTPEYMAPERLLQPDSCDVRSDLFSVGTTLFQLLAGYPPSQARRSDPAHSRLMAMAQAPPPLREARPDAPPDLARVVHRLLEKVADARPSGYDEVIESLRPFASGADLPRLLDATWDGPEWSHPRTAAPAGRPPRPPRRRGLSASLRHPVAWLATGLTGASLLLV